MATGGGDPGAIVSPLPVFYVLEISVCSNDDSQLTRPLLELSGLTIPIS